MIDLLIQSKIRQKIIRLLLFNPKREFYLYKIRYWPLRYRQSCRRKNPKRHFTDWAKKKNSKNFLLSLAVGETFHDFPTLEGIE